MTDIRVEYDETANGWKSEELTLRGDAYLDIELMKKGYVVIRQGVGDGYPTVLRSDYNREFEIKLCVHELNDADERSIYIYTSEEPKRIRYASI